jgi:proteasome lid subunit RPN8/RPN11
MIGFHRSGELIVARFDLPEAQVFRHACSQMLLLLGADPDDPSANGVPDPLEQLAALGEAEMPPPEDPALHRLLPDAYLDDPAASARARRFTEDSLRAGKVERMRMFYDGVPPEGGDVSITEVEADAWLRALTDLRLVLAVRLDIDDDETAEELLDRALASEDDSVAGTAVIYRFAGILSETLIAALMGTDLDLDDDFWPLTFSYAVVAATTRCCHFVSVTGRCGRKRRCEGDAGCITRTGCRERGPVGSAVVLKLPQQVYDEILAHARRDHPDEACGLVAGPVGSDAAVRIVPMANAERSPTFYRFDAAEQLKVWREMDDRDEEPVVIYHSHTATEAYPSRTDISYASEPNAHYVLVSTRDEDKDEFRSYRILDGVVTEEPVQIVDPVESSGT